jgi:hypothetical protein
VLSAFSEEDFWFDTSRSYRNRVIRKAAPGYPHSMLRCRPHLNLRGAAISYRDRASLILHVFRYADFHGGELVLRARHAKRSHRRIIRGRELLLNFGSDGFSAMGGLVEVVRDGQSVVEFFDRAKVVLGRQSTARSMLGPLPLDQIFARMIGIMWLTIDDETGAVLAQSSRDFPLSYCGHSPSTTRPTCFSGSHSALDFGFGLVAQNSGAHDKVSRK